jgi:hypothetical protein
MRLLGIIVSHAVTLCIVSACYYHALTQCNARTYQVVCMSLLQKTLGPEFSQLHMLRPHDYAVCQQGPLWRLTEAGLLVKRTKRYCFKLINKCHF